MTMTVESFGVAARDIIMATMNKAMVALIRVLESAERGKSARALARGVVLSTSVQRQPDKTGAGRSAPNL